ncbi:MAG: AAA family ATPase [Psychroserpens sp.]|uniref:AAA family ATPase n=1 Tax=Psychroserpens sp. TaxID=2020870 RepID=UPI003C8CA56C
MVKKAYSYSDIAKRKFKMLELDGEWKRHLGVMEISGSVIVMGDSGAGKTTYALKMSKAISPVEVVLYNSAEEGIRASFKRSLELNQMIAVKSRFRFVKEDYDQMFERLKMKRQPKVVIIDSAQYFFRGKTIADYFKLIETYNNTLFIFLSHIKAGLPKGTVAEEIYYDCQNRILVKDFAAYVLKSRCDGDETKPLIIVAKKHEERNLKLVKKG